MSQTMIDVKEVTAAYGAVIALKGVCLSVQKGEIFGLLGPNGAGKLTLLVCVAGFHTPTGSGYCKETGIGVKRVANLESRPGG